MMYPMGVKFLAALSFIISQPASADLHMDQNYDLVKGCYDQQSGQHRRILLTTAAEIQERILSKDFECTEMSDVVAEGSDAIYRMGNFPDFKVVKIEGTGGSLGNAGIFDFNFKGAKIANLFLDYQVAIGGDTEGLNAKGIYLAFYAKFASKTCHKSTSPSPFPSPPYFDVSSDGLGALYLEKQDSSEKEARIFFGSPVLCNSN